MEKKYGRMLMLALIHDRHFYYVEQCSVETLGDIFLPTSKQASYKLRNWCLWSCRNVCGKEKPFLVYFFRCKPLPAMPDIPDDHDRISRRPIRNGIFHADCTARLGVLSTCNNKRNTSMNDERCLSNAEMLHGTLEQL